MSSEFSPELRQELLDDFYAESDEHLTAIRQGLALAESAAAAGERPKALLDSLLGSLHSLKGICAIVGLEPAEQLAHASEDLVRDLSRGTEPLGSAAVDALLQSGQRLEQLVAAHRSRTALPGIDDVLAALQPHARRSEPAGLEPAAPAALPAPRFPVWRCVFSPSREQDARGINLESVRKRLGRLGTIRRSIPSVQPGGAFRFVFEVEMPEPPGPEERTTEGLFWEAPAAGVPAAEPATLTPSHIVRVDLARLDELMRIAGELVIQRSRLRDRLERQDDRAADLREIDHSLGRSLRALHQAASRVRLVPIGEIFSRMPFVVRDLARASAKRARVQIGGHQTEIDKYVVERLKEPLLHLVRNAFSHGLESAAERLAAGKSAEGSIFLDAKADGDAVVIRVRDDGRGIDPEAIAARARALGLKAEGPGASPLELLCLPGFSTRDQADRESGRGVGMAVVASTVRELGGVMRLESTPGRGSEFVLRLPLSLSIIDVLIIALGPQRCAVPQSQVREIAEIPADSIRTLRGARIVSWRDQLVPLTDLRERFGLPVPPTRQVCILLVPAGPGLAALAVDRVLSRREVVVRPLGDPLVRRPGVAAAAELGDGRPILILEPSALAAVPEPALA